MKTLKFYLLLVIALPLVMTSCEDDDDTAVDDTTNTITDLVVATEDLSSLEAAVLRADLAETLSGGEYTVFAPTNDAFDAFLTSAGFAGVEEVPVDVLRNILLNHVVSGTNVSTSLVSGYVNTAATAQGNPVSMYINTDGGVTLNGVSSVASADIDADNGVVHVVDAVINLPTVVDIALADPDFSILVSALTREQDFTFVETLSTDGPFTVFAPDNDAFVSLLGELNVNGLADIDADLLANVLSNHVAAGNTMSTDLSDQMRISTLSGELTTVIDGSTVTLVDGQGRGSIIEAVDIQASNGVIHQINTVVLP